MSEGSQPPPMHLQAAAYRFREILLLLQALFVLGGIGLAEGAVRSTGSPAKRASR
jgi:hypothetical protein